MMLFENAANGGENRRHEEIHLQHENRKLRQSNQQLVADLEQIKTIVDLAANAMIVINQETRVIIFNQMAETLFGYASLDIVGQKIDRLLPETHVKLNQQIIRHLLPTTNSRQIVQGQAQRKDGSQFPAEIAISQYRIGDKYFVTAVIHDMSLQLKNQQDAIRLAIEHERVRMLRQFIDDASHEFRTPLAVIRSKIYLLQRMLQDRRYAPHLEVIDQETQKIAHLLESLLHLQRLEIANTLQKESRPLHDLLMLVIGKQDVKLRQKRIHLQFDLNADNDQMKMDDLEISLAIGKVLENAIQYSPIDGTVFIHTLQHGNDFVLVIRDEGEGISEEDLPYVFERFYRADKAHSTAGFGLGLSIARSIIEKHAGNIQIASKVNKGTIVQIVLPLEQAFEEDSSI